MKKLLLQLLTTLISTLITLIGVVCLFIAFKTKDNQYYIFIPSMIISWFVLLPVYGYWDTLLKQMFKIK